MSIARSLELISVDDYLQGELRSAVRHEYVGGVVYAMTGGTNAHAKIMMNCGASLHSQLSGHPCDVFPVVVYRRSNAEQPWERVVITAPDSTIDLPEISTELPLEAIYRGIEF